MRSSISFLAFALLATSLQVYSAPVPELESRFRFGFEDDFVPQTVGTAGDNVEASPSLSVPSPSIVDNSGASSTPVIGALPTAALDSLADLPTYNSAIPDGDAVS
jgi:hypothetical protein